MQWQSSEDAATLLSRRIDSWGNKHVHVLAIGALLGKEFDMDALALVTDIDPTEVIRVLDEARQRHFIWLRFDESRHAFVHDKVRQAFLNLLDEQTRRSTHLRIAESWEQRGDDRPAEIAYHFDAAGMPQRAYPYAIVAAEQARSQHAFEVAEQQYRIAVRSQLDAAARFQVLESLGDVVTSRGHYQEAEELFQAAEKIAANPRQSASIAGKRAALAFKRGDMEGAINEYDRALRLLGLRIPWNRWWVRVLLGWEIVVQVLHSLLPQLLVGRCGRLPDEQERLALRLLSGLAHGCWYARSKPWHFSFTCKA
jgi:two-component system sensor kinase